MTVKKNDEPDGEAALYAVRNEVLTELPEIIRAIIARAKEGSYQHAKFLIEFADDTPKGGVDPESQESLADMLMRELRDEPTKPHKDDLRMQSD